MIQTAPCCQGGALGSADSLDVGGIGPENDNDISTQQMNHKEHKRPKAFPWIPLQCPQDWTFVC